MSSAQTVDNRLVEISRPGSALVVRRLSSPYRTRMTVVAFLFLLACLLFAIALTASWEHRQFRFFLWLLGIAVILLSARMFDIRIYSAKEEAFYFDKGRDTVEKNGQELAPASEVDHILVRRIRKVDYEDVDNSDYALVVALQNTKRFTLAETDGVPGARAQITQAAEEVARYLGVPVKEGERSPTEYWMDR